MLKYISGDYLLAAGFTSFLILAEAILWLLFPMFIGYAVDDAITGTYEGVLQLGGLGIATLIVGAGRRLFDSRFYAKIYQDVSVEVLANLKSLSTSAKSARLGMARELIEFLEFSLPELVHSIISLLGVMVIIATLSVKVFYGTLIVTSLIMLIYLLSSSKTLGLSKASNDEHEQQVEVISRDDTSQLRLHLKKAMKWNISLSDLEAMNFALSWMLLIIFLLAAIIVPTQTEFVQYGVLLSLIIYVFQYMENIINIPFFYQSWLRLKEITGRLFVSESEVSTSNSQEVAPKKYDASKQERSLAFELRHK